MRRDARDESRVRAPAGIGGSLGWSERALGREFTERLLRNLAGRGLPTAGIVGPWGHKYPFSGYPGPRVDWLRYVTTHWWDRWLKGKEPDPATEWPQLVVWMGVSREPGGPSTLGTSSGLAAGCQPSG